jgi:hypothetical protein
LITLTTVSARAGAGRRATIASERAGTIIAISRRRAKVTVVPMSPLFLSRSEPANPISWDEQPVPVLSQGRVGAGTPEAVGRRLLQVARAYATPGHPVLPMFELIATVAHPFPTPSGLYRTHQHDEIVQRYLTAVRRIDGILVLDVQPGRADFVDDLRHWEPYLRQPDVGVAVDPEVSMGPGGGPPPPSTGPRRMSPASSAGTGCPRSCSWSTSSATA